MLARPHASENPATELTSDALAFFQGCNEGGMGRWTYMHKPAETGSPQDTYWDDLIRNNSHYYPSPDNGALVNHFLMSLAENLYDCRVINEIGPGSRETTENVTLPIVKSLQGAALTHYVATDTDPLSAEVSAQIVADNTDLITDFTSQDFFDGFAIDHSVHPKAIMLLGGTIGNLKGEANSSGLRRLAETFNAAAAHLKPGDALVFSFDTETDKEKIDRAYNGQYNSRLCLSFLDVIKRECDIQGYFRPQDWRHQAVWYSNTQQVAHIVWPLKDQDFSLDGVPIQIKAGHRFVMNNSYKFPSSEIHRVLEEEAGLKVSILQLPNNPMVLAIARRPPGPA